MQKLWIDRYIEVEQQIASKREKTSNAVSCQRMEI